MSVPERSSAPQPETPPLESPAARRAAAAGALIGPLNTLLLRAVAALDDAGAAAPSALPGWSRGHLVTHLARNADALGNLLTWANTGVPTPMYRSGAARDEDIAAGAPRPAAELLADLRAAGDRFADALRGMPERSWAAEVTDRQGQAIPAHQIPWMRVTELVVHLMDLDAGYGFDAMLADDTVLADIGDAAVTELLDGVVATYAGREHIPAARVEVRLPSGALAPWTIGSGVPVELTGDAAAALGWLTGRDDGAGLDGPVPPLPDWR